MGATGSGVGHPSAGGMQALRVLYLEPFYGGTPRSFLDQWAERSRHVLTVLGLPARHWKWRMRHAGMTFAHELGRRLESGGEWDVLWCSDMLDLAELRGLAPTSVRRLPSVLYFHESQLTYPVRRRPERDAHFAWTNLSSALAAVATQPVAPPRRETVFDGAAAVIAGRLEALARRRLEGPLEAPAARRQAERFLWRYRAPALDRALDEVASIAGRS